MDISGTILLMSIAINTACTVYVISQGAKAVIWVLKFFMDEHEGS